MRRVAFFSSSKKKNLKRRKNTGVSYRRGNLEGNQYVFNGPSENEDDSEEEIFALRQKKKAENLIEIKLQPGDSLLNIALQYGYSVEELKRINNILRENEIFARTTLKIPSRITEVVAVHKMPQEKSPPGSQIEADAVDESRNVRTVSIGDAYRASKMEGNDADAARRFLVAMDRDLAKIREKTLSRGLSRNYDFTVTQLGTEDISLSSGPRSLIKPDTSWRCVQLLICSILLGFIAPILYVLYLAEEGGKQTFTISNDTVR
ncbi:lysM and putative peptidoglycan-binding domain-containing protein 3 [Ischnura elegans]|uniref:lysM and putative peptidoglycan-binding domain-containing protein 3 n=1 Tax=Ischnura elegans TaxID=197161 RepID=UPI001ED8B208|nr:lysM and putative peptidoglycan-binding domain-containing protein 3 [Ischnura elegans]